MKLGRPQLWIASLSAAAVLVVAVVDVESTSPGPLAAAHAALEPLEGGRACSQCHGGWTESMTDACLDCHGQIGRQVADGLGLHGSMADPERCALCHSEHHGPTFRIVNRQSFVQAGVSDPSRFDHARVGFAMAGRHLELACAECHELAAARVLAPGQRRFLGLDRDCATCHDDPHDGRLAARACADCHGQSSFEEQHATGHERFLPLRGAHAELGCRDCHAAGEEHSLERLTAGGPKPAPRDCLDCHDSPHASGFLEAIGRRAGLKRPAESCSECHLPDHLSFRDPDLGLDAAQHAASGFALAEPHEEVACDACHDPALEDFRERYPGRAPEACSACHDDPHEGQFEGGPFSGGCLSCHDPHAFEPVPFGRAQHARTALPLDGAHAELDCQACHSDPPAGRARAFHGTPGACDACHQDAHRGAFDAFAAELDGPHGVCAACHRTRSFSELPPGGFEHERFTGFELAGAHEQADCRACHPTRAVADQAGRTFGFAADSFGPLQGCATCHRDPHRGRFDARGLPARVRGREGCARCHDESSFRVFPHGFDHARWTGFPLDGAHAKTDCGACHARRREPDSDGRTWEPAAGTACAACHADPHAGQFRSEGRPADCARCHRSSAFEDLRFDHERDARFALGDAHAGLDCAACHEAVHAGGREVTRYRPLPTECVDCHGVHQDVFGKRRRR